MGKVKANARLCIWTRVHTTRHEPDLTLESWRWEDGLSDGAERKAMRNWDRRFPIGVLNSTALLESAGDLPAELADQSPRTDPDPVMLRAGCLMLLVDPVGIMPGQALNDQGAQTEQQGQQGRINPGQFHVSHLEFGIRPRCRIPVVI